MQNKVSKDKIVLNTYFISRWFDDFKTGHFDVNKALDIARQVKRIDGVEVFVPEGHDFNISETNRKFLESLNCNSVHSNHYQKYKDNQQTKKILEALDSFARTIKANYILFHPNAIIDFDFVFRKRNKGYAIENLYYEPFDTVESLRKLLKRYEGLKFVLDVNHAKQGSEKDIRKFIDVLKNYIISFHISYGAKEVSHSSLMKADSEFLEELVKVKQLNLPLILEVAYDPENIHSIQKEVNFVRSL